MPPAEASAASPAAFTRAPSNTCSGLLLLQKLLFSLVAGPFFLTSEYSIAPEFNIQTLTSLISLNDFQLHSFNTVW